ncbi:hemolysin-type calcium-binding protein [Pararhodobacter marinus]|uniref:Hemolysin-type calcium-binding protein n=1 Tax=Pararhodobacter marinus TaxID=2184063 RepID=A0A2U2C814_9RHOB|nr:Hint domain-containing protein [Pararhodobacter marinus]PWE28020.1 hemolysin-type calcium-binding protein [Pararhodobacter marinus]
MSSVSGFSGVYVVEWAQTAPGEEWGLSPDMLAVGMSWRWRGDAQRLDAGVAALWLARPQDRTNPRSRARRRLRRLALAGMPLHPVRDRADPSVDGTLQAGFDGETPAGTLPGAPRPEAMLLTDGERLYPARLVRVSGRLLVVFHPMLPAPDTALWIAALSLDPRIGGREAAQPGAGHSGVICFLPGTAIATPDGPRAVETLAPGERVLTRDNGAQPVIWRGETRLSGAELYLHPHLRPVRIASGALPGGRPKGDLLVSPAHRLLLRAPGCLQSDEVLVAAGDLEDGRGIRRDFTASAVRYVHLMLARHEILTANGVACESFHPGLAEPRVLKWHARSLEQAAPGLLGDLARFGDPARQCLSRGEAGILRDALV